MKKLLKQYGLVATGPVGGAAAGFLYWKFIGCSDGTCAITSNPVNSSIWFAVTGAFLFSMFQPKKESRHQK